MTIEDIAYITSEKSGYEHCIRFIAEYYIENDSIGSYEYWGAKGYDYQPDYLIVDSIECYMVRNGNKERRIITNDAIDKEVNRIVSKQDINDNYEPDETY